MTPEDLLDLMRARRTIRCDFLPQSILREDVQFILEAARWAPSGHNLQPWEFIAIKSRRVKKEIAESTMRVIEEILADTEKLERTFGSYFKWFTSDEREAKTRGIGLYSRRSTPYLKSEITPQVVEELKASGKNYCKRIVEAPLLLVTLLNREKTPPNISSGLISLISIGAAVQNIRLAAVVRGIGCQDMARPIDTVDGKRRLKKILSIPKDYEIVSVMRLGYINPRLENIYRSDFRVKFEKLVHYDSYLK